jgi:hypothetical protein
MLSKLEAITQYPDTEESRLAGSAVRAASLMLGRHRDEDQQGRGLDPVFLAAGNGDQLVRLGGRRGRSITRLTSTHGADRS